MSGGTPRPVDFYVGLLTSEYANSANLQALLRVYLEKMQDVCDVALALPSHFDLDGAVGVQLDALGDIVGVKRTLPFQPENDLSPVLDDEDYRTLIRARIGKNHWDGKIESLYSLWQELFPTGYLAVLDNQDMTMSVYLMGSFSPTMIDCITHDMIVPRPEGVKINYYMGDFPLFGHDFDNDYVSGHDVGKWYTPTIF